MITRIPSFFTYSSITSRRRRRTTTTTRKRKRRTITISNDHKGIPSLFPIVYFLLCCFCCIMKSTTMKTTLMKRQQQQQPFQFVSGLVVPITTITTRRMKIPVVTKRNFHHSYLQSASSSSLSTGVIPSFIHHSHRNDYTTTSARWGSTFSSSSSSTRLTCYPQQQVTSTTTHSSVFFKQHNNNNNNIVQTTRTKGSRPSTTTTTTTNTRFMSSRSSSSSSSSSNMDVTTIRNTTNAKNRIDNIDDNSNKYSNDDNNDDNDTIFALSSGTNNNPGQATAVAVIRLSGPHCKIVLQHLLLLGPTNTTNSNENIVQTKQQTFPRPRYASLRTIYNWETGDILDKPLILYFPGPKSYTGEDIIEIHCHGSRAIISEIIHTLQTVPYQYYEPTNKNNENENTIIQTRTCRLAERGEFTQRAWLNNKMDMIQLEGLADLLSADTNSQIQMAMKQYNGLLSILYDQWRTQLINALAHSEAIIDFGDDETLLLMDQEENENDETFDDDDEIVLLIDRETDDENENENKPFDDDDEMVLLIDRETDDENENENKPFDDDDEIVLLIDRETDDENENETTFDDDPMFLNGNNNVNTGQQQQQQQQVENTIWGKVVENMIQLQKDMVVHLDDGRRGEIIRDGIKIVIVGAPNSGKSSLFNVLAQRDAAIVSSIAGTTRDIIEITYNLQGMKCILQDTAGIRTNTKDTIEMEGMKRSYAAVTNADLVIVMVDSTSIQNIQNGFDLLYNVTTTTTSTTTNDDNSQQQQQTYMDPMYKMLVLNKADLSNDYYMNLIHDENQNHQQQQQEQQQQLNDTIHEESAMTTTTSTTTNRGDTQIINTADVRSLLKSINTKASLSSYSSSIVQHENEQILNDCHWISCTTQQGIDEFLNDLSDRVANRIGYHPTNNNNNNNKENNNKRNGNALDSDDVLITRARHRQHVQGAVEALERFLSYATVQPNVNSNNNNNKKNQYQYYDCMATVDLAAEELRLAASELGRVTGAVDVEDVLDKLFTDFCIGK